MLGRYFLIAFACLTKAAICATPLQAATHPKDLLSIVTNAVANIDDADLNHWAYTLTTVSGGAKTIEKHNPSAPKPERWQLLLKDDKTPTEKDLSAYAKQRRKRGRKPGTKSAGSLIDPSKIVILSNDLARIYCRIELNTESVAEGIKVPPVRGTLTVLREPEQVERWEVSCTEKFGKTGVFSISELRFGMAFQQHQEHRAPLPESVSTRIRGRALIFKSLNMDSEATYSDFAWKGKTSSTTEAAKSPPAGD